MGEVVCEYCLTQWSSEEIEKESDGSYSCPNCRQDGWNRAHPEPVREGE